MVIMLGIFLLVTFVFLSIGLSSPHPEKIKQLYKYTMLGLGVVFILVLLRIGLPQLAALLGAIMTMAAYANRLLQFGMTMKAFRTFFAAKKTNAPVPMTRTQALEVLGLSEGATSEQIETAYKTLMKKNHPDAGGTDYFARQLNQAREILMKDMELV